jgi:hypothetical protein
VLFFTEAEARQWATTGAAATGTQRDVVPTQPGPARLQKPDTPATPPADFLTGAWSSSAPALTPTADPAVAAVDFVADAWSLTPPACDPDDGAASATPPAPAPVDDDQVVGLREAHQHHLPDITVAALRPRQRPHLPRLGRQARRRTPLPRP